MKITFYSCKKYELPFLKKYNGGAYDAQYLSSPLRISTVEKSKGSSIVSVFSRDDLSESIIVALKKQGVKFIATRSTGYNHIDLTSAEKHGIKVAHVPDYSPHAIAEHAVLLMLAVNRKLLIAYERMKINNFSLQGLLGCNLGEQKVGIIGTSRIGQAMIQILNGFGSEVVAYDIAPNYNLQDSFKFKYVDLNILLSTCDIISLHIPLNNETQNIIDRNELSMMKREAILINTSRGKLINTKEVITALESNHISALGIDVYENEDDIFFEDHSKTTLIDPLFEKLRSFDNVIITGHQAFLTKTAFDNISRTTVDNINNFLSGTMSPTFLC